MKKATIELLENLGRLLIGLSFAFIALATLGYGVSLSNQADSVMHQIYAGQFYLISAILFSTGAICFSLIRWSGTSQDANAIEKPTEDRPAQSFSLSFKLILLFVLIVGGIFLWISWFAL